MKPSFVADQVDFKAKQRLIDAQMRALGDPEISGQKRESLKHLVKHNRLRMKDKESYNSHFFLAVRSLQDPTCRFGDSEFQRCDGYIQRSAVGTWLRGIFESLRSR